MRLYRRGHMIFVVAMRLSCTGLVHAMPPSADGQLHWKWSRTEVLEPEGAIATLDGEGAMLGVISGRPPELALERATLAPVRMTPHGIGDYLSPTAKDNCYPSGGRSSWMMHPGS